MNIVLVGLELAPGLVRTGAAESLLLLSKALRLLDFEVTVVLPYLDELKALGLLAARRLTPLELPSQGSAFVYESALPSGAELCLLEPKERGEFSHDIFVGPDADAKLRWFSEALVAWVSEQARHGAPPDVVHAVGLRPGAALAALRLEDGAIGRALSLLAADDLEWVGQSSPGEFDRAAGLSAAETIVVPAARLASVVEQAQARLGGRGRGSVQVVFEGLDTGVYNPATDSQLPFRYTPYDLVGKRRTRQKLRAERGLDQDPERPLLVVEAGGGAWDERLSTAAAAWVRQGANVAVVARGRTPSLGPLVSALPDQVAALPLVSASDLRRWLGAADFFLEPASEDWSGRSVLEAQRYGAVPVLGPDHKGRERVVELDAELATGSGFTFQDDTSAGLVELGGRLLSAFRRPRFNDLPGRLMAQDFAWDRPGRRHAQIYRAIVQGPSVRSRAVELA